MARIIRDDVTKYFDNGIYIPTKTIDLSDMDYGIDSQTSTAVLKGLHVLDQSFPEKPITVRMNSIGGDIYHGLAIYDALKECQSEVIIKVYGQAMSMAVWILQAGTKRLLSRNSRLMIHVGDSSLHGHSENVKRWAKQLEADEVIFEDILLSKIREKHENFSRKELQELLKFDTILTPQKAIKLGLADGLIEDVR